MRANTATATLMAAATIAGRGAGGTLALGSATSGLLAEPATLHTTLWTGATLLAPTWAAPGPRWPSPPFRGAAG